MNCSLFINSACILMQHNCFHFWNLLSQLLGIKWSSKAWPQWQPGFHSAITLYNGEHRETILTVHSSAAECVCVCVFALGTETLWENSVVIPAVPISNLHTFAAFEGAQAMKCDRATRRSISLIGIDKNTDSALLNCWHWTDWIRLRILTTGDRLEGTVGRPLVWRSPAARFRLGSLI